VKYNRPIRAWRFLSRVTPALVALWVGVFAAGAAAADDDEALRAFHTANGLLNRGLYELAIPEYEHFLREHPHSENAATARYRLAVSLHRLGRAPDALEQLDLLWEDAQFEFAAEVALLRGHCNLGVGRPGAAAPCFERIVRDHPAHAHAAAAGAMLVEALHGAGDHAAAVRTADEVSRRSPDSRWRDRAELFAGLAEMALGDPVGAAKRFDRLATRRPDGEHAIHATLLRGQCLQRMNKVPEALDAYDAVRQTGDPRFAGSATLGAAQLLRAQGKPRVAAKLLDELIASEDHAAMLPAAILERGRIWLDLNEPDRARQAFERLAKMKSKPFADDAAYWLAKTALRAGHADNAAARLAAAAREHPKSELLPLMRYDLAVALSRANDRSGAIHAFDAFARAHPMHALAPDAMHAAAAIEHERGRYDETLARCEQFARAFPRHALAPDVAFLAIEGLYLSGRHERAAETARGFLARHAAHALAADATFRLGMALDRLGRADEAKPFLKSAAALAPDKPAYAPAALALARAAFDAGRWLEAHEWLSAYLGLGEAAASAGDALLRRGITLRRLIRPEDALADFERVARDHADGPHAIHASFERGQALLSLGREEDAEAAFERVLEADPQSRFAGPALHNLASIASSRGQTARAAELFARASESGTGDLRTEALYQRGVSLLAAERFAEAAEAFDAVARQHADHPRAPAARAQAAISLFRAGDLEAGFEQLERVRDPDALSPKLAASLAYERAWALRETGQTEEAATAYAALLEGDTAPELRMHALLDLAAIEMDRERFEAAMAPLDALAALRARERVAPAIAEQADYRTGACALKLGRFERAADAVGSFHEAHPESDLIASAALIAGEAAFRRDRHREAIEHLERAARAGAGDPPVETTALLRLGESTSAMQRWADSEEAFTRFLERYGEHELWFQARFGLGWACENQNRLDEAMKHYREVVSGHNGATAARAQFQIGECLFARGEHESATRELLRVDILYAYPEWSAAALYEAGRCFEALGKTHQARAQYAEVTQRFADSEWARLASDRLAAVRAAPPPGHGGG